MYWAKGCKRCGGDLMLEWDETWSYVVCIRCGNVKVEQGQLALIGFNQAHRP